MSWTTIADIIAEVEPLVDSTLIDFAGLEKVRALARTFPAVASDYFGFERQLASDDRGVDFSISMNEAGLRWLRHIQGSQSPGALPIAARLDAVALGHPPPWLEFDLRDRHDIGHRPSLYLGFNCPLNASQGILDALRALGVDERSSATFDRCVMSMPASVKRLYAGSMSARGIAGVRFACSPIRFEQLGAFLSAVGWPGDFLDLAPLLERIAALGIRFGIQLDIDDHINRGIGIELVDRRLLRNPGRPVEDNALLLFLVSEALCTETERRGLLRWTGTKVFTAPLIEQLIEKAYPTENQRLVHGELVTALQHVKLVYDGRAGIASKAYFGIGIR